ncbi:MAG TPA: GatB/YqeY domain-containing protein [Vicinamibacterales bacterium]|nr:GatB/YqeY domain-containing protein [Vicinamibacterales bacterium]
MKLTERINTDLANAMRARETLKLGALRMLKTAFTNKSVEKGHDLEDAEAMQVINTLIKQRRDSIEQFQKGGRQDLADKEAAEITVLEAYLPPPISEAELSEAIEAAVTETGAASPRDMGKVMKAVMAKLADRAADGRVVSEMVKRRLG